MLHSENLRKADETYEVRFNSIGEAIHVYIKDGEAIVFPSLDNLVGYIYLAKSNTERLYLKEEDLDSVYSSDDYDFYIIARKYPNNHVNSQS